MFGRVILLNGEHAQAKGKLKNEWKNTRQWASDFAIDLLWQTSTTTRAEFKKQIDNRIDIRDN
jgi:hypothetical protein